MGSGVFEPDDWCDGNSAWDTDELVNWCENPDNYWRAALGSKVALDADVSAPKEDWFYYQAYDTDGKPFDEHCWGTREYCDGQVAGWWIGDVFHYRTGDRITDMWCYGVYNECHGVDDWCEGTWEHCDSRVGPNADPSAALAPAGERYEVGVFAPKPEATMSNYGNAPAVGATLDYSVYDPDGFLVYENWCHDNDAAVCDELYGAWWELSGKYLCYGSRSGCENPASWCDGGYRRCYEEYGFPYARELKTEPMIPMEEPRAVEDVRSPGAASPVSESAPGRSWGLTSGVNEVFWGHCYGDWDLGECEHRVDYCKQPGNTYGSQRDFDRALAYCQDPDNYWRAGLPPEPGREERENSEAVPGYEVGRLGEGDQVNATNVTQAPHASGTRVVMPEGSGEPLARGDGAPAGLFASEGDRAAFGLVMGLYGSGLDDYGALVAIKYLHTVGALSFDIGAGDGTGAAPARPACGPGWTVEAALAAIASGNHGDAQKRHCLELVAERGHFAEESLGF